MATHPDSEQLALLALKADVDESVQEHLRACEQCQRDLSLLESLLAADGPDSDASGIGVASADEQAAVDSAWADGDGSSATDAEPVTLPETQPPNPGVVRGGRSATNPTAFVAVLVIVLVSIALAVFALR
jgi:hypothetical protein